MLGTTGNISQSTLGYIAREMLEVGEPLILLGRVGKMVSIPANNSGTIIFTRYEALPLANALTEGIQPASGTIVKSSVTATLAQIGAFVEITDVVQDTHIDPVISEVSKRNAEQAVQTMEARDWNVLKAGTNKYYSNGTVRTSVNTPLTVGLQRKIERGLQRGLAKPISEIIQSSVEFNRESVPESYFAYTHSDMNATIRDLPGFVDIINYGGAKKPLPGEIGYVGLCRYFTSSLFTPYANGGGAAGAMITTGGTSADVYPIVYMGRDAYAGIAFKGKTAITPIILNPTPTASDRLGQVGSIGWKSYHASVVLNQSWIVVAEVAITEM